MPLIFTVVDDVGTAFDVHLDADPDTPVGAIAQALAESAGTALPLAGSGLQVDGADLPEDMLLRDSPLRDAVVVGLGRPVEAATEEPRGLVEVRAVGGRGAGSVHRLDIGEYRIGLTDDGLPQILRGAPARLYALLRVGPGGRCVLTPQATAGQGSGVALRLDHEDVEEERTWPLGGQLLVGGCLLELVRPEAPDAAVQRSEDGAGWDYNRPPRLLPPESVTKFRIPTPPVKPAKRPLPYIAAITPLVMAAAGVLVFHRLYALLFGLLSPVAIFGNYLVNRRAGRDTYAESLKKYEEKKERIETEAEEAVVAERIARRQGFPDPAAVLLTAVGPRRRLWERRRSDADFLELRVGTADQPSAVVLEDPTRDEHRRTFTRAAFDVPVTVALREHKVLGIAGGGPAARSVARWALAQAAVLHSPRDLQIYVLSAGHEAEAAWTWIRWLPHVRQQSGDTPANIGTDTESSARRVAELTGLIAARAAAARDHRTSRDPDVLVVLDGARRLRSLPGVVQILRDGPAVGVHAICLDSEQRLLPEECQAVVTEEPGGTLRVGLSRSGTLTGVRTDAVSPEYCRSLARALGPLRDSGGADEEGAVLPSSARLLDVLALDPPTAEGVAARWKAGGRSTSAVVGVSLDGPFALDIRRDGPHGLVAGTTGSGKSELLQTLVASLAVANRPDAMTFVLVDYKGGSAFKDCVDLPHTVGMVTDLDAHLVERALTSLSAELKRREHILAEAGAKDIEDYVDLLRREPRRTPMPRLLIVIDEFASMVRDLPDFVKGLVNIAQRGRSLGIHLILATQRPGGVVSPEIRANTNLRIALRVTDAGESQDVLTSPEAAGISKNHPGRAYVRLGQSSLVPFQAGRVGGRRPGAVAASVPAPWVVPLGWDQLGRPLPARPRAVRHDGDEAVTDLRDLVEAVRAANTDLDIAPQHSPWLPALPVSIVLDDLPAVAPGGYDLAPVAYALVDLPADQAQRPLALDLATLNHLHVVGAPRAGRSQTLRTIAGALARAHSSADLHLYGIDCGNGALLALDALPHCGAVVQRTQPERLARLLSRLTAEVTRRQELLAARGFADLPELRSALPAAQRPPHIMVLLDRWEVFEKTLGEYDGGNLLAGVLALLRDGASVGIHLVLAGDRSLFSTRISSSTEDKLVLRLNDKSEYSMIGVNSRSVPDDIPSGRALRAGDKAEVHIALLGPDGSGQAQAGELQRIGAMCAERDAHVAGSARPFRVDVLPDRLGYEEALERLPQPHPGPLWAMAGVGGDELTALGPDFAMNPTFIVGGPPRSGRSTALLTMALSLLSCGTAVVVGAPRRSPLRGLAGTPGVLAVFDGPDIGHEELTEVLAQAPERVVVFLDDADLLLKTNAEAVLNGIARSGAETGQGLVLSGQIERLSSGYSGWHTDARRNRQGMLLSPQSVGDGELIGVRIPRSRLGGGRAGRAMVHLADGVLRTVQVPETAVPPAPVPPAPEAQDPAPEAVVPEAVVPEAAEAAAPAAPGD
ncbi:FtsK/SpoIIIE domain-containing protein [Streptomyces sp. NPDC090741]|uniref:FtsK/SpoIIIE domain-containing protein n=1 Tax=Streptomyces sp. NPDC090741 TaxID=3365967 RepID=UPI003810B381